MSNDNKFIPASPIYSLLDTSPPLSPDWSKVTQQHSNSSSSPTFPSSGHQDPQHEVEPWAARRARGQGEDENTDLLLGDENVMARTPNCNVCPHAFTSQKDFVEHGKLHFIQQQQQQDHHLLLGGKMTPAPSPKSADTDEHTESKESRKRRYEPIASLPPIQGYVQQPSQGDLHQHQLQQQWHAYLQQQQFLHQQQYLQQQHYLGGFQAPQYHHAYPQASAIMSPEPILQKACDRNNKKKCGCSACLMATTENGRGVNLERSKESSKRRKQREPEKENLSPDQLRAMEAKEWNKLKGYWCNRCGIKFRDDKELVEHMTDPKHPKA